MINPRFVFAIVLMAASPAQAAPRPLVLQAELPPYTLRVIMHFPEGKGREREAQCSAAQRTVLQERFQRMLAFSADGLIEARAGRGGKTIDVERLVSCGPDGGVTISGYRPDDQIATEHYEAGSGWSIAG